MELHLFSVPGEPMLRDIVAAAREILAGLANPLIAYLPAAATDRHYVRETKAVFRELARVETMKAESHPLTRLRSTLARADLLYIPGGNTYLMAQRLHAAGLMDDLRERLRGGLPLVAFSAGAVLCGPDIRTSNDDNDCGCTTFDGLGLVPFSINVHFPAEPGEERETRLARLRAYTAQHQRRVLAMEDSAYVKVTEAGVEVVRGDVWWMDEGLIG